MDFSNHNDNYNYLANNFKHGVASPRTSERYSVVNTMEVIDGLVDRGFLIDKVTGAASMTISNPFERHRVTLVNPDLTIDDGRTCARVILQNSYNAKSSFRIIAGLFRFACSNGLIIGQVGEMAKIQAVHVAGVDNAIKQADEYLDKLPKMNELIQVYRDIEVADELQVKLALELATTRQKMIHGNQFNPDVFKLDTDSMLVREREADKENDAWTIFNILQEKVMNGGYLYDPKGKGKIRIAKAIKNTYTKDRVNEQIFTDFKEVLVENVN